MLERQENLKPGVEEPVASRGSRKRLPSRLQVEKKLRHPDLVGEISLQSKAVRVGRLINV